MPGAIWHHGVWHLADLQPGYTRMITVTEALPAELGRASVRWGSVCESAWCSPRQNSAETPQRCAAYGQRVEDLGFTHLLAYDHVVGADPAVAPPAGPGPYDVHTTFHEPLVMFGYLAAVTTTLELVTGVVHPAAAAGRACRQAGRRG